LVEPILRLHGLLLTLPHDARRQAGRCVPSDPPIRGFKRFNSSQPLPLSIKNSDSAQAAHHD